MGGHGKECRGGKQSDGEANKNFHGDTLEAMTVRVILAPEIPWQRSPSIGQLSRALGFVKTALPGFTQALSRPAPCLRKLFNQRHRVNLFHVSGRSRDDGVHRSNQPWNSSYEHHQAYLYPTSQ